MGNTISVRLTENLTKWLDETARKSGLPKGKVIRQELERARSSQGQSFMRLAGSVSGPSNLSARKGFALK